MTAAISFDRVDLARDRDALLAVNVAYLEWLAHNIQRDFGLDMPAALGVSIPDYVAASLDKLCAESPPVGAFYLVRREGEVIGMGGLRRLDDAACEMKRVFVLPTARGSGLGAAIVNRLIADGTTFGYRTMMLDSAPFMTSAHRLYEAVGFRDRGRYPGVEAPEPLLHHWRFMERELQDDSAERLR